MDLIYLDPPFNSNATYNLLFKPPSGAGDGAQLEAFEDTWHWSTPGVGGRLPEHLQEEFFATALREKLYDTVASLQADLDQWLHFYNDERPRLGYRNQGRRPWDTVASFVREDA